MRTVELRVEGSAQADWEVFRNGASVMRFAAFADAVRYARRLGYEIREDGEHATLHVIDTEGRKSETFAPAFGWGPRFNDAEQLSVPA